MNISWAPPDLGDEEKDAAYRVLESGWVKQGKETQKFEEEICRYLASNYAVAINNETSALIAALLAKHIKRGDEVIVPSYTFIASINSILAIGATPVLVDCSHDTWNTEAQIIEDKITERTKAIMPVDVGGLPVDIDPIRELAEKNGISIVRDSAESFGAEYKGRKVGSRDTNIFSFHIAKQCTSVEGGIVTVEEQETYEKLISIRNHGMSKPPAQLNGRYDYINFGLNLRINDIQSAIGRVQLKKVDSFLSHRNNLASIYLKNLMGLEFQDIPDYVTKHPWMFFGALFPKDKRDSINMNLNKLGIATRICWLPAHKQTYHKEIFKEVSLPVCESIAARIINLPLGNSHTKEEINHVCDIVKEEVKE